MDKLTTLEILKNLFKEALAITVEGLNARGDSVILRFHMDTNMSLAQMRKIEIELDKGFYEQHRSEFYTALTDTGSPYKPLRDNEKGFPKL